MYNVPLNELEEIIDYSLENGYTIAWAADVSEKGLLQAEKGLLLFLPHRRPTCRTPKFPAGKPPERERENELYKLDSWFRA